MTVGIGSFCPQGQAILTDSVVNVSCGLNGEYTKIKEITNPGYTSYDDEDKKQVIFSI